MMMQRLIASGDRRAVKVVGAIPHSDATFASIFYFKVTPQFANRQKLSPYQTVVLMDDDFTSFVGHIEPDSSVKGNGLHMSEYVLKILGLKVGGMVNMYTQTMIPAVTRCDLIGQPTQDQDEFKPNSQNDQRDLAAALRYHPIPQGITLQYKGRTYKARIYPQSNPYGFIGTQSRIKFQQGSVGAYPNCIGLEQVIAQLRSIIDWPTKYPDVYQKLRLDPPRGILLYGPPGCGKTHLVRTISTQTGRSFFHTTGTALENKYVGQGQRDLRNLFMQAKKHAPAIIFIDQIDNLVPPRDSWTTMAPSKGMVTELLTCMDGLESRGDVIVIGATNKRNALDPAITRPGRFDKELRVSPPNEEQRRRMLAAFLKGAKHTLDIPVVARSLNGYTPADIILFVKQMKIQAATRYIDHLEAQSARTRPDGADTLDTSEDLFCLGSEDAEVALRKVRTTLLRGLNGASLETIAKHTANLGGYAKVKRLIHKMLVNPSVYPTVYKNASLPRPRGILLHGPPGTGKTTLARSLAATLNSNLILMNAAELKHGIVGQSQKMVRELFSRARDAAPTILVLDQIDAICPNADHPSSADSSTMAAILSQIDGTTPDSDGVLIIGTTNRRERVPAALTRAGRLEMELLMDYPTPEEVVEIFEAKVGNLALSPQLLAESSLLLKNLARKESVTGADVMSIVRDTLTIALDKISEDQRIRVQQDPGVLRIDLSYIRQAIAAWYQKRDQGARGAQIPDRT